MTGHRSFCVPHATAALLDYLEARRPQVPYLRLYFVTPDALVDAASKYDIDSDWYEVDQVIDEVERRLSEGYVATRRKIPMDYFAEWDLKAK
jgi:hypothetical protein